MEHENVKALTSKKKSIRLSLAEEAKVLIKAESLGLNFSEYCRTVVLEHKVVSKERTATHDFLNEIRRLGGLFKKCAIQNSWEIDQEMIDVLRDIKYILKLHALAEFGPPIPDSGFLITSEAVEKS